MRKRSGALHSESEEDYMKLAQLAEEHCSLFYDEMGRPGKGRKRKYAMSEGKMKQRQGESLPEPAEGNKQNPFQAFDFDQQTDNFLKDCNALSQIQQKRMKITHKFHFVIICPDSPLAIARALRQKLGAHAHLPESLHHPPLDLIVHHSYLPTPPHYFIDCFWVISKTQIEAYPDLLSIYIRTCTRLVDLSSAEDGACLEAQKHKLSRFLQMTMSRRVAEYSEFV